jgi:hypothetical protein
MSASSRNQAEALNRDCACAVTDLSRLQKHIDSTTGAPRSIVESHPHLFSSTPVFLDSQHHAQMRQAIGAITSVVQSRAYQARVLGWAPDIAKKSVPQAGVFFGYDFHIGTDGPKLIEINTNAGGAFLNIAARDAQIECCDVASAYLAKIPTGEALANSVVDMFQREWRLARKGAPLRRVAIVDDAPSGQFLYPEFLLAKHVFESHGIDARISDLSELKLEGGQVTIGGETIDLIYNRSTDFYLESSNAAALRGAFERDLAVVTPHPAVHALYANKRNLILLSNADELAALGVDAATRDILVRNIPPTLEVRSGDESWWTNRKAWFFKPESGFGSRGTYRGDKMTRRVFAEVSSGEYIAQQLTPAGERIRVTREGVEFLKADIRCYVYEGAIQLMAARLYQGQTTNFRTAGGGFAPVYLVGNS